MLSTPNPGDIIPGTESNVFRSHFGNMIRSLCLRRATDGALDVILPYRSFVVIDNSTSLGFDIYMVCVCAYNLFASMMDVTAIFVYLVVLAISIEQPQQ